MTIPESKKSRNLKKFLFCLTFLLLGVCIGLLTAWGFHRENDVPKPDAAGTNSHTSGADALVAGADAHAETGAVGADAHSMDTGAVGSKTPGAESTDLIVDYPFSYGLENWQLVLHKEIAENGSDRVHSEREFRLYNGDGQLVQTFPCIPEAEELTFQFDRLFYYYKYDKDLVVFPADAGETGAKGLCYPWNDETEKFSEYPVEIPLYQKSYYDNAFLTTETMENTVINTICMINEESRQVVELRKWVLTEEEQDGRGALRILDCLTGQELYRGEVEWNSPGNLVNNKYYQHLFWQDLGYFWSWTNDNEIRTTKVTQDSYEIEIYQNREELLAEYGFAGKEPFFEYDDYSSHLPELELFFDEQTGQGCGIVYRYEHNYALEQVTMYRGFYFVQVTPEKWKPEDTFSTLSIHGDDARAGNVSDYKEIYEYTDDGKLSSFEARGIILDYGESEEKTESTLLSMSYAYRGDGTLYYKQYYHHPIQFGSYLSSQSCYYDEQGRIVCKYCYTTSGSIYYYYIYMDNREVPAYCLMLDLCGGSYPKMISYEN